MECRVCELVRQRNTCQTCVRKRLMLVNISLEASVKRLRETVARVEIVLATQERQKALWSDCVQARSRVRALRESHRFSESRVLHQRELLEERSRVLLKKRAALEESQSRLKHSIRVAVRLASGEQDSRKSLNNLWKICFEKQVNAILTLESKLLTMRSGRLRDFCSVIPIRAEGDSCSIMGLVLPNEAASWKSQNYIVHACIGHAAHFLLVFVSILDVCLPRPFDLLRFSGAGRELRQAIKILNYNIIYLCAVIGVPMERAQKDSTVLNLLRLVSMQQQLRMVRPLPSKLLPPLIQLPQQPQALAEVSIPDFDDLFSSEDETDAAEWHLVSSDEGEDAVTGM